MLLKIEVSDLVVGDHRVEAWRLYTDLFTELNRRTVQRHLMSHDEFADVCQDSRIEKWRVLHDDRLVGLATYTNRLESMPLISPAYFAHRWPEHHATGRIWYCGFVGIAEHAPQGTFLQLIGRMYQQVADCGGVISLDYCAVNARLARAVERGLTSISGKKVRAGIADTQSYWVYETDPDRTAAGDPR